VELLKRFDSVRRVRAGKSGAGQDSRQQLAAGRVIIRYQDSFTGIFRHGFSFDSKLTAHQTVFFWRASAFAERAFRI
jgi:hypothetical protein